MDEKVIAIRHAQLLAAFSVPVLVVYAVAQSCLAIFIAPKDANLRLLIEPYLLLLGLILHVQWRRVTMTFLIHEEPRPVWVASGDCLSFVITFWAFSILVHAFLVQAKLL